MMRMLIGAPIGLDVALQRRQAAQQQPSGGSLLSPPEPSHGGGTAGADIETSKEPTQHNQRHITAMKLAT
jgi:hypothetical protein